MTPKLGSLQTYSQDMLVSGAFGSKKDAYPFRMISAKLSLQPPESFYLPNLLSQARSAVKKRDHFSMDMNVSVSGYSQ